jgi:hypothetical protein
MMYYDSPQFRANRLGREEEEHTNRLASVTELLGMSPITRCQWGRK